MARELNQSWIDKLAKMVKAEPGNSERFYSEKANIPMSQILRHLIPAELKADPSLKVPATGKGVVAAHNKGLRIPRIAGYAGISVNRVKELYEAETGHAIGESYVGRGRNFSNGGGTSTKRTSTPKRGAGTAKKGTSGRRSSAKRGAAAQAAPKKRGAASTGRRGTRAQASSPK